MFNADGDQKSTFHRSCEIDIFNGFASVIEKLKRERV